MNWKPEEQWEKYVIWPYRRQYKKRSEIAEFRKVSSGKSID